MSYGSLWAVDKETYGEERFEYENSWLFAPVIWDILVKKYLGRDHGATEIMLGRNNTSRVINKMINTSDSTTDRVLWELSQQQMFFAKDKEVVFGAIGDFLKKNKAFFNSINPKISERFRKIAGDIMSVPSDEYPYFILKNTSCDDSIENLFGNQEKPVKLNSFKEHVIETVKIDEGKIVDFISNRELFRKE